MCMMGVVAGCSLCVPSFANVSAILFPRMPMWALTFVYVDFVQGPIYLVHNCCYKQFV